MSKKIVLASILVISAVAVITYLPALKIGFYDGWWYLEWAATMGLPRYLIQFLDPANITQGYRPVQGLYIYLLYHLFGLNPDGYHLAHTALHALNAVLLFFVVNELGGNHRSALVASLLFATSPVVSLAVFWHAVVDPLAGCFYLLTILLWTKYLKSRRPLLWVAAFAAFVLALFSKEIAVILPLLLFLVEWWFLRSGKPMPNVRPYLPFVLMLFPHLWLVTQVQSHGEFSSQFGFRIGPHMITNLMPYLAVLAFPWTNELPADILYYIWLGVVVLLVSIITLYKRSLALVFLGLVAILNISPLTGFPLDYFNTRYLYLPVIVSLILFALVLERAWKATSKWRLSSLAVPVIVAVLTLAGGQSVAQASAGLAEFTRLLRVPFRDISSQHPSFPSDSYLYFVYSPTTPIWDFEGLFFVRYGTNVKVNSTETGTRAELREHSAASVYYFDPTGRPVELPVDKGPAMRSTPPLPASFGIPIVLQECQIPSSTIQRGKALVALLSWRAQANIDRDYTVFAHLVDENGNTVAAWDGPPRRGDAPTRSWKPQQPVVDALVLPIGAEAPLGSNFRLELGVYDAVTMERLAIGDSGGQSKTDAIVLGPFSIVPQAGQ